MEPSGVGGAWANKLDTLLLYLRTHFQSIINEFAEEDKALTYSTETYKNG